MSFFRTKNGFTQMPVVNIPADPRLDQLKITIAALKVRLFQAHGQEQLSMLGELGVLQRTAERIRRELLGVTR